MKKQINIIKSWRNATRLLLAGTAAVSLAAISSFGQTCQDLCDSTLLNTARGYGALQNNTGDDNTAIGAFTLLNNSSGKEDTAIGAYALISNTSGTDNNALGTFSLFNNTSGYDNTGVGNAALSNNTTGYLNTGVGFDALDGETSNTALTGNNNVAVGALALGATSGTAAYNTAVGTSALEKATGSGSTAIGASALANYDGPGGDTAVGYQALSTTQSNVTGQNTAIGYQSLYSDQEFDDFGDFSGVGNTGVGDHSLFSNTDGVCNVALGVNSLYTNDSGFYNIAVGDGSLYNNIDGYQNIAIGQSALGSNAHGYDNTAVGNSTLFHCTGNNNTCVGVFAGEGLTTGSNNIAVGSSAGTFQSTGSNNIDIGNKGVVAESNTIRIGKKGTQTTTIIAGINGTSVAGGIGVLIDSNGRLGTTTSSARYKENIQPMAEASESILSLKPVTFRYKKELDSAGIPQFGLVAEQVAKVNPALVVRDDDGKPYSVRYEAVNAMLLNEFLKEHRKVESQAATIAELKSALAQQQSQIKALTSGLEKVNTKLEMTRPTARVVNND